MKIDDKKQLESFLRVLTEEIQDENIIEVIGKIIDVDRLQTFSKKMLLLQWYFFQGSENFQKDAEMYDNALKNLKI